MLRKVLHITLLIGLTGMLGACATQKPDGPLTPLPEESAFKDPGNMLFMQTIQDYVTAKKAPAQTRYEFTRIDLDGDSRREGIVMLKTPHQYWCDFNGCSMAVFKAHNNGFELISEISPVRGPLVVREARTNGWRDILVRVSGRAGFDAKDVALQYDGRSYPPQPAFLPAFYASYAPEGISIFP